MSPITEKVEAIKLIIVSAMMMDYSARMLEDRMEPGMMIAVNKMLMAVKEMENHYVFFHGVHPKYKEIFTKEFKKEEYIAIAQLIQVVQNFSAQSIDDIREAIENMTTTTQTKEEAA